ncbi:MAG: alpha/beta fold hydrolase [Clostridia bacterium]|nr:alpha/beta fold hydrolase [Clostridia bacterium]
MKKLLVVLLCMLLIPMNPGLAETAETQENDVRIDLLEEDVSIGDPALPGTLTLPEAHLFSSYPLPAVVLLHGSGPSNRDEAIGQTALFRDLAQFLAMQGIAALRYDKRTFVYGSTYTTEDLIAFTVEEESIRDAIAAAELLRADPRIDPDRIYLIGHSLGATIAPRIVQEHPGLFAGIVMLSGTPKTLGEIVLSQNQAIVDSLPALTKAIGQMQMTGLRREWDALLNCTAEEAKTKTVFGQPGFYFWEMAQYDTASILQSLDLPVLIINGGQDFQVIDADGIDAWNALDLPENVQVIYHKELNHLLMNPDAPESARGTVAEYDTPCHLPQEIIWEICRFILD